MAEQSQPSAPSAARYAAKAFFLISLLMLLVVPVLIVPVGTSNPAVHSKELALRFLLGFIAAAFVFALPALKSMRLDMAQAALLAVVGTRAMATAFSSRPGYSFLGFWHLTALPLFALLLVRYAPTARHVSKILAVVVAAAAITAFYGLSAYFGFDFLRWIYPFELKTTEGRNYIHSFLGNPEYFGGYMAPIAVLCFASAFKPGVRVAVRLAWLAATAVFLLALLLSGTRGAALGFVVGCGLLVLRVWPALAKPARRAMARSLAALMVAAAAVVVVFSFPNPLNFRDTRLAQRFAALFDLTTPSMRERLFFFSVSGRMIAEDPVFGDGPGTFRLNFYPNIVRLQQADDRAGVLLMTQDLKGGVAEHAHCDYLEIWAETGTAGLAAILFLFCVAVVWFVRTPLRFASVDGRAPPDDAPSDSFHFSACFAAAAAIFVNAAFSFPLHLPVRASLAWALVGCYFASARRLRELP